MAGRCVANEKQTPVLTRDTVGDCDTILSMCPQPATLLEAAALMEAATILK